MALIAFASAQKNLHDAHDPRRVAMADASMLLRESLEPLGLPSDAQIVVDGLTEGIEHAGNNAVNSGLLRYLLGRTDISGIIGNARFPTNAF